MAFGVWRLAFGVWRLAFGVWRLAFGVSMLQSSEVPKHRRITGSARLARARQPINGIYALA
ncbi:tryptophanyl-tRNA synthetase [Burkholderia pseudomallei]|nr:tryptophanyl-tRNA synthetase [Burkholderia pseudomallei]MBM5687818.1 tryptophanyl-tRNA synthetase [Burkholderia pseudomallei]RPA02308.1 tryptophanyl-tRNA synthetase [Burkholderia pseudomallei]